MAAAMSLQAVMKPLKTMEFAKIPVGKAAIFTVAMGLGDFIKAATFTMSGGRVPQMAVGLLVAWALMNVKMLKNVLGPDVSELAALGVVADTINDQFAIRERTANLLSGFLPGGPGVVSKSPPVLVRGRGRPVTQRMTGRTDIYGSLFGR